MTKTALIKKYCRERDAMLRTLDTRELNRFAKRWRRPVPAQWAPKADIACMHKMRLFIMSFSDEEKAVSRRWLLDNGFVAAGIGEASETTFGEYGTA